MKTTKILKWLPMLAVFMLAGSYAFSKEGHKLTFRVVDAKGNADTVVFAVRDGATDGIDPELGEINLYGQPANGDLDMRIIQRTDVNCEPSHTYRKYWLCPGFIDKPWACNFADYPFDDLGIESCSNNLDLKIDYRTNATIDGIYPPPYMRGALQVYAKNYPVTIYAQFDKPDIDSFSSISLFGGLFDKDGNQLNFDFGNPTNPDCWHYLFGYYYNRIGEGAIDTVIRFNNDSENNLVSFGYRIYGKSSISKNDSEMQIYPNPSKEYVTIEDGKDGEKLEIVSIDGKVIKTFTVESYPYKVDIIELTKGIYYIRDSKGSSIYKFVKE